MISFWIILATVIAGLALLEAFLLGCASWEHRRAARKHLRTCAIRPRATNNSPRVALIAPCKGLDLGLKENLRSLFCQEYGNYELRFVVESIEDPASPVIGQLMAEYPQVKSSLVVAGKSTDAGQKVHGLRAATEKLAPEVELLAFIDSDARPHPEWLGQLLQRLARPRVGIVTGYRWFVPQRPTWANYLLYSINATAASLYSPKGFNPVWGGSWAIRRELFDRICLRDVWDGALTDDLVATNLVHQAGYRIEFEPACVIASQLDSSFIQMFLFLRRQYMIGRHNMWGLWSLTLLATTLTIIGFWGAFVAAGIGLVKQSPGTVWPVLACTLLYGAGIFRATIRRDLAHLYLPKLKHALAPATGFDLWMTPFSALLNWAAILSTVWGRHMVWREVTYRLLPRGKARVVFRSDEARRLDDSEKKPPWILDATYPTLAADRLSSQQKQDERHHQKAA